jgi:hypothetical protein
MILSNGTLKIRGLLGVGTLAFALALPGCGGGDSETTETISKAQYVKQADAICSKTENRQLKLVGEFNQGKNTPQNQKSEEELVLFAGLPPLKQQAEELSELPKPSTGAQEVEKYVSTLQSAIEKSEDDPGLMLLSATSPFANPETLARKIGFKACSGA